jgi:hypothetical protein
MSDFNDPLLNAKQCAELAGMPPGNWRSLVNAGWAPTADDPGDLEVSANRRNPKWRRSTVARFLVTRRGPRRPRKPKQEEQQS